MAASVTGADAENADGPEIWTTPTVSCAAGAGQAAGEL